MPILTNAIVTAYCACRICCGPDAANITASGKRPVEGITIAVPRSVPLGTRIVIGGVVYTAQDRTAKRYDGRFDIYFKRHKDAIRWGKQRLTVTIYD
jgi:3D (Asp-Asp-Asp) domain-containing protein